MQVNPLFNVINSQSSEKIQFEREIRQYLKKAKKRTTHAESKQFYETILNLFRFIRDNNQSVLSLLPEEMKVKLAEEGLGNLIESAAALVIKPNLDREAQKRICSLHLAEVQKNLSNICPTFNLQDLAGLFLEELNKVIVFVCFYETVKHLLSQENTDNCSYFFEFLHQLVSNKVWKNKKTAEGEFPLEQSFREFCEHYKISTKGLDHHLKVLRRIYFLSLQETALSQPIEMFVSKKESAEDDSLGDNPTFHYLIALQKNILSLVYAIRRVSLEGLSKFRKEILVNEKHPIYKEAVRMLRHRIDIFMDSAKMSQEEEGRLLSICQTPTEESEKFLNDIEQLLADLAACRTKVVSPERILREKVEITLEGCEVAIPYINRHEHTNKDLSVYLTLHSALSLFFFNSLNLFFDEFTLANLEMISSESYHFNPLPSQFLSFMIDSLKLISKGTSNSKKKKLPQELNRLILRYSAGRPNWYKQFLTKFSEKSTMELDRLFKLPKLIAFDFYDRLYVKPEGTPTQIHEICNEFQKFFETMREKIIGMEALSKGDASKFLSKDDPIVLHFISFFSQTLLKSIEMSLDQIHDQSIKTQAKHVFEERLQKLADKNPENQIFYKHAVSNGSYALSHLNAYRASFEFGFHFFIPAIAACWKDYAEDPLAKGGRDHADWFFSIDFPSKKRRRVRRPKASTFVPKTPKAAEEKEKNVETIKEEPTGLIEPFLPEFYPPHAVDQLYSKEDEGIFQLDQAFHLKQANWTLELIEQSLNAGDMAAVGFLGSKLINHLYLMQEQALTPLYLRKQEQLRHGLQAMSQALNLPCSEAIDQGSLWYRYPHSSFTYYKEGNRTIPEGLRLILTSGRAWNRAELEILSQMTIDTCEFLNHLNDFNAASELKILKEKAKRLSTGEKEKESDVVRFEPVQMGYLSEFLEKILKLIPLVESDPSFSEIPLLDLSFHLRRLILSMDLMEKYPDQRFLSFHDHNIRTCSQYVIELAFSSISMLQGEEFHTHNFKMAASLLGEENPFSIEELDSFRELNIKKGVDYPYYETAKAKEQGGHAGLQGLSSSYELSMTAERDGVGFVPVSYSFNAVEKNRENLEKLIKQTVDILSRLENRMIAPKKLEKQKQA